MTAAALVLLGRPLDRAIATYSDDEQARGNTGDDLELRSERRGTPSLRMGDPRDEEGSWSIDLGPDYVNIVPGTLARDYAFAAASRQAPRLVHRPALSARGPPSARA